MSSPKPTPVAGRFWTRVSPEPMSGCFLWTGACVSSGYGTVSADGRRVRGAHRVAWELVNGPIPDGLWVLHKCDNRACVNPDHLFLGTNADNMADMARKGRGRGATLLKGVNHPLAKLQPEDVRSIRAMLRAGATMATIARRFGITRPSVAAIRDGRSWAHVREEAA